MKKSIRSMTWDGLAKEIIFFFFLLFCVLYAVSNLFFTVYQNNLINNISHYRWNSWIHYFLLGGALFALYRRKPSFSAKKFLWIFLGIVTVLGAVWVSINPQGFGEYADPYNVYRSAKEVAFGNYAALGFKSYINTYPNNLGLLSVLVLYCKAFGEWAALFFRLTNVVFVGIGYYYLYLLSERIFQKEEVQRLLVLLFVFSTQFVFLAYFVYGNVVSYALGIVATYFFVHYLQERKVKSLCLAMGSVLCSVLIKNNSAILLVAMSAYLCLDILNRRKPLLAALSILLLFVGFWTVTEGVIKFYEKKGDISYDNRLPKIAWIAYGSFNYDRNHPGGYLSYFEVYHHENDYVTEYTELFIRQHIDRTIRAFQEKPYLVPEFMARKMLVAWSDPEFEVLSVYRAPDAGKKGLVEGYPAYAEDLVGGVSHIFLREGWDLGLSLTAIGLLLCIRRKQNLTVVMLVPAVIVVGGFLFHSFWEIKSVYLYQYYLFLLPYAADGLTSLRKGEDK